MQVRSSHARVSAQAAFSLLELTIALLVVAILAGVAVPRLASRSMMARDARRLADLKTIREAIDQYYLDHGNYPVASSNAGFDDWDVSHDGGFIPALLSEGYIQSPVNDPIGNADYHYRYYLYAKSSFGCAGNGPFYVLAATKLESPSVKAKNPSYFACSERDWASEFDFVTGGGASYE